MGPRSSVIPAILWPRQMWIKTHQSPLLVFSHQQHMNLHHVPKQKSFYTTKLIFFDNQLVIGN